MRGGAVAGGRRRGSPPDGSSCSRHADLQQFKSFVEMCIVSCLNASPACVCGRGAATWGCPRGRLPCRRDSPAPIYCTGPPRPPTPRPRPQQQPPSSQSQGQVPITEQNFVPTVPSPDIIALPNLIRADIPAEPRRFQRLSRMVRVSDVPHWTKSAGTVPP
jgi:hypothetical protein